MLRPLAIGIVFALGIVPPVPAAAVEAVIPIPVAHPQIEYAGRFDFANCGAPRFSHSGCSVRARFHGTSLAVVLENEGASNVFNIIVDSSVTRRLTPNAGLATYTLAEGLADAFHDIEIYKLTEPTYGKTTFLGFLAEAGKSLVPLTDPRFRVIEFIGDSITCGSGIEGGPGTGQTNTNQNHSLSYAAITSRNFNARHTVVAKSGVGLFINYSGKPNTDVESPRNMKHHYPRTHFNDPDPLYIHPAHPDLICINLGTNDFNMSENEALFEEAYHDFISALQYRNPGSDILCLVGPMLSGRKLEQIRPLIQRVASTANAKNHGRVVFFELSQQGALGFGGDTHPNVAQHAKNAEELTAFIATVMGWSTAPAIHAPTL